MLVLTMTTVLILADSLKCFIMIENTTNHYLKKLQQK